MNKYKRGFAHITFIVIGVLVLVIAVAATIALVNRNGKTAEIAPMAQNNVPQNQSDSWKTYNNSETGFSFSYPTSWGEIREYSKLGYYDWYKNTDNPSNQCINLFLSAQNFGTNSQFVNFFKSEPCPAPRDGSYFESSWIKDQKTIDGFCKVYTSNANIDSCTVTKNKNDITFARLSYKDVPKMDSDTGFGSYIFYYMYSPNASRGMAFVAKPENAAVMDKVVDSLRFTSISTNLGANWKKYQSEKYGFELSYPSTWVIKTDPQMEGWVGFSPADKHDDSPTGGSVKVEDNVKGLTLNGLFEEVKKIPYYYGFEFFSVGGEQALQYRSNEFAATRAVVVHGGKIYTLGNEIVTNAKILSSFKFMDEAVK
jgi:hypothetical protein